MRKSVLSIATLIMLVALSTAKGGKIFAFHPLILVDENGRVIISQGSILGEEETDQKADQKKDHHEDEKDRDKDPNEDDQDTSQTETSISTDLPESEQTGDQDSQKVTTAEDGEDQVGDEEESGQPKAADAAREIEEEDEDEDEDEEEKEEVEEHQGRVELKSEEGEIEIKIRSADGTEKKLKVKQEEGKTLIRVREGAVRNEIRIKTSGGNFVIEQRGNTAQTQFPLTVDTETNQLIVSTPFGQVNVQVLPAVAIENILAANVVDQVDTTEIVQNPNESDEQNKVVYRIQGVKQARFLGLLPVTAPITTEVGVVTGETVSVKKPWYLNFLGFLFRT